MEIGVTDAQGFVMHEEYTCTAYGRNWFNVFSTVYELQNGSTAVIELHPPPRNYMVNISTSRTLCHPYSTLGTKAEFTKSSLTWSFHTSQVRTIDLCDILVHFFGSPPHPPQQESSHVTTCASDYEIHLDISSTSASPDCTTALILKSSFHENTTEINFLIRPPFTSIGYAKQS